MVERVLYCKRNISVSVMEAAGVVVLDAVHWSSGGRWGGEWEEALVRHFSFVLLLIIRSFFSM